MARVRLTKSHHINGKRHKAGTVICDGTGCSAGDVIWSGLNATSFSNGMVALDAGATTIQNASRFTTTPGGVISGADSIDG